MRTKRIMETRCRRQPASFLALRRQKLNSVSPLYFKDCLRLVGNLKNGHGYSWTLTRITTAGAHASCSKHTELCRDLSEDEEEAEAGEKCKGALEEQYRSIDWSSVCEAVTRVYFGTWGGATRPASHWTRMDTRRESLVFILASV